MKKILTLVLFLIQLHIYATNLEMTFNLKENVISKTNEILIKEIADVQSSNEELNELISNLKVGDAPNPGLYRFFSKFEIIRTLRKEKYDTQNIKFTGSKKIKVSTNKLKEKNFNLLKKGKTNISLMKIATVKEDHILLKDISSINTKNAELKEQLENILIGESPNQSEKKLINKYEILRILKENNIPTTNINFLKNSKSIIIRPSIILNSETILKESKQYLLKRFSYEPQNVIISLKSNIKEIILPILPITYEFILLTRQSNKGSIVLNLNIIQDNQIAKSLHLSFFIRLFDECLIAKEDIDKDSILSNKVKLERMDVTNIDDYIKNPKELNDKISKRYIRKGKIISHKFTGKELLIKRGQIINMFVSRGPLKIQVKGKSLEKGYKSDFIRAKNIDTGKIITGKIFNSNSIVVEY